MTCRPRREGYAPAVPSESSPAPSPLDEGDRREFVERRKQPTRMMSRWLFRGRRRGGRRHGELDYHYVDRLGPWVLCAFIVIVGLSSLDAWYTLDLLAGGNATEANPVMRAALHLGEAHFVFIKTGITILAVGFLCLHKNWPLGRLCIALALCGYSLLIVYHLFVQERASRIPPTPSAILGVEAPGGG